MWLTQQPILVPDITEEHRWPKVLSLMREDGVKSFCLVPLTTAVRRLGVLEFASVQQDAYGEPNLEFLQQVGKQVAVAVDNVLHHHDLARDRDRLQLLLDVNNSVVSTLDLREIFAAIGASLRRVMPHDRTSLVLYEPELNRFRLHASDVSAGKGLIQDGILTPVEGTPSGPAFTSRKPALYTEQDLQRLPTEIAKLLIAEGVKSMCCVPLLSHNRARHVQCLQHVPQDLYVR